MKKPIEKTVEEERKKCEAAVARKAEIEAILSQTDITYIDRLRVLEEKAARIKAELRKSV